MKKARILIFCCCLLLVGCTNGIEKNNSEQKNDGANWSKKRTNLFSSMDYPELSKKDAGKLMEDKFDLMIPPFFEQSLALMQKILMTEDESEFTIKSDAEILTIQGKLKAGKENTSPNYAVSAEAQFQVNQQKQQVYLTKQWILIQNSSADSELPGESVLLLLRKLGKVMELPDLDQVIKNAEKKIAEVNDKNSNQLIEIYNDSQMEQQHTSRILTISYDKKNCFKEIYGLISIE
ncbi:hypothetical protein IGL98_003314 [Enterococcus sp. DIV0840]|uniref:hypothetical protein n=1 Tax=Enterococcus TaxID=1350 RepID=UPI001A8E9AF3|nr:MULTISPECIES: hypothetical protein [Enterococcus]MBO0435487.1 hypothetical protein [Enterococcus sp. DIV0849a]MBO0473352.1 hypothetical protein [Enterococcus ureasiticus]